MLLLHFMTGMWSTGYRLNYGRVVGGTHENKNKTRKVFFSLKVKSK